MIIKPTILEVKRITKRFLIKKNSVLANDQVSFNVTKNRHIGLLGANGAGKTTLVEMLVGINTPDSGTFIYNFDYTNTFKEGIGVQFQESSYPFGIRTKDIIQYFLHVYKIQLNQSELDQLLTTFGISKFYCRNCSALSGGQLQRLNLLLSLMHRPKLLILDELSTGLDVKIRNEIKEFIKAYTATYDMTMIVVSHDINEIDYLCDDIVMMKEGKVVDVTTKEAILHTCGSLEAYIDKYI